MGDLLCLFASDLRSCLDLRSVPLSRSDPSTGVVFNAHLHITVPLSFDRLGSCVPDPTTLQRTLRIGARHLLLNRDAFL